jgi:2-phosphoglycerate kinase
MPSDLAIGRDAGLIKVRDRGGVDLPFSKGLMASSMLATGLETGRAHAIAADIEAELRAVGIREIKADELAELAARAIKRSAGADMGERYHAWRRAKRAGRPLVICLEGTPGVGKSTFATRLALRLGISRVIPTDAIREVLRTVVPETVLPELHVSTYESVESGPEDSPLANFRRQAHAVGSACAAVAARLTDEHRSVVLEGVHLLPGEVRRQLAERGSDPIIVELLLTAADEEHLLERLNHRLHREPARGGHRHLLHLRSILRIQEELRHLARRAGIPEHDVAHPEDLTQRIVDQIVMEAEASVTGSNAGTR